MKRVQNFFMRFKEENGRPPNSVGEVHRFMREMGIMHLFGDEEKEYANEMLAKLKENKIVKIKTFGGETIAVSPETPRWTYKVFFQDGLKWYSENGKYVRLVDQPYVVVPVELKAIDAAKFGVQTEYNAKFAVLNGENTVGQLIHYGPSDIPFYKYPSINSRLFHPHRQHWMHSSRDWRKDWRKR